jgi:hypothetical protein
MHDRRAELVRQARELLDDWDRKTKVAEELTRKYFPAQGELPFRWPPGVLTREVRMEIMKSDADAAAAKAAWAEFILHHRQELEG